MMKSIEDVFLKIHSNECRTTIFRRGDLSSESGGTPPKKGAYYDRPLVFIVHCSKKHNKKTALYGSTMRFNGKMFHFGTLKDCEDIISYGKQKVK